MPEPYVCEYHRESPGWDACSEERECDTVRRGFGEQDDISGVIRVTSEVQCTVCEDWFEADDRDVLDSSGRCDKCRP